MVSKEYIAGFVDGEGYLGIMKMRDKRNDSHRYVATIKVGQLTKNDEVLHQIQKRFGGRIEHRIHKNQFNCQDSTSLNFLNNIEVKRVAEDIFGLMIVKRKQCKILLDFLNLPRGTSGHNFSKGKMLEEKIKFNADIKAKKAKMYLAIRKLNKVGKGVAETE